MQRIAASYDQVWICGRTLVNGPADLAAVHRIQKRYQLIPLADYLKHGLKWKPSRPRHVVTTAANLQIPTGLDYYTQLGRYMQQDPPPARDAAELAALKAIGVGPGLSPTTADLSSAVLKGLTEAANAGLSYITTERTLYAAESAVTNHGWFVPSADTGDFGTDYLWRGIVAVYGLAANVPAEAMYIVGVVDQDDMKLNGADRYVITFPADALPPARYFWSLTMYDADFSLVPNSLGRYALANHIPGLKYSADGSLTVYVQHSPPPADEQSNWLPAPAAGNFEVTLRLYGPGASALDRTYTYPSIRRVGF